MPNKESRTGSFALLSSGKLINQLEEIFPLSPALAAVSVTVIGVRPVVSAISADNISGLTGTMEYWLAASWPTFLGIFVTR
jgi:hypothetical protein